MSKLILPPTLEEQFQHLTQPVEVCDGSGRVLGRFTPNGVGDTRQPQISEEELKRRQSEPEFSTEEVLAYLEKL